MLNYVFFRKCGKLQIVLFKHRLGHGWGHAGRMRGHRVRMIGAEYTILFGHL